MTPREHYLSTARFMFQAQGQERVANLIFKQILTPFQVVVNQGQIGQPYYGHQQLPPPPLPAHSHSQSKSGLLHPLHPHPGGQPGGHYQGGPVESGASSPNAKVRRSGMPLNSDCHLVNTNETLLVSRPGAKLEIRMYLTIVPVNQ